MRIGRALAVFSAITALAGCGVNAPDDRAATTTTETAAQGLDLHVTASLAEGTFAQAGRTIRFRAAAQDGHVVDVTVEVGDLTLDAVVDSANRVSQLDGFGAANGQDTQILDQDRVALAAFSHALDTQVNGASSEAASTLARMVSLWAEHPTTVDLARTVMGEENRSWTMLCGYAQCPVNGSWSYTGTCSSYTWYHETHDDWDYDRWNARSSQYAQLGDHSGSTTWYWTGTTWLGGSPDHWSNPYEVGDCNGRCGADCGSGHVYSQDCADHDGCVRNGHSIASLWCDDEFTSASDDFTFAPNCY